jgi:ABC-2 type transport system ATP-binding protein
MRRRLDLAVSFLVAPPVLFLDEPTTGLDPHGRAQVWRSIRALAAAGTAVLLTTQHLEEADQLASSISILRHGRVAASGTPDELKSRLGGDRIEVVVRHAGEVGAAADLIRGWLTAEPEVDPDTRRVGGPVRDRVAALTGMVRALAGVEVEDIVLRRPTLDEVFLSLVKG